MDATVSARSLKRSLVVITNIAQAPCWLGGFRAVSIRVTRGPHTNERDNRLHAWKYRATELQQERGSNGAERSTEYMHDSANMQDITPPSWSAQRVQRNNTKNFVQADAESCHVSLCGYTAPETMAGGCNMYLISEADQQLAAKKT